MFKDKVISACVVPSGASTECDISEFSDRTDTSVVSPVSCDFGACIAL